MAQKCGYALGLIGEDRAEHVTRKTGALGSAGEILIANPIDFQRIAFATLGVAGGARDGRIDIGKGAIEARGLHHVAANDFDTRSFNRGSIRARADQRAHLHVLLAQRRNDLAADVTRATDDQYFSAIRN